MKPQNIKSGFALLCDEKGSIKKVIKDNAGIFKHSQEGNLIFSLIDGRSRSAFLDFLNEIKTKTFAYQYAIDFVIDSKSVTLFITGVLIDAEILIVSADNKSETFELINQIQLINNEYANTVRQLIKEKFTSDRDEKEENNRIYNDITALNNELVNLQRELSKKNAELEKLNELKNRFLGMAAHDLRNPIGIITSYSEFLMEENTLALSDEHKEFLEIMNSSAQFMQGLIDDLLDVSKIEAGKIDLHLELFSVEQLITRIVIHNRILSKRKNIEILMKSSAPGLMVFADKLKLEQVFTNLISNGIKFSDKGSKIWLEIYSSGDFAVISVRDNGQGIPVDEIGILFKPFQKTSVKSTAGEKSTGLGLMIAKRIVEAHKGTIKVESKVGQGTSFIVELPASGQYIEVEKGKQN
jgi:signal transduction histidine kinase